MKTLLKLAAVVGILTAASLAGGNRPAFAYPTCESLNGTPCTPIDSQTCMLPDGSTERCVCTLMHTWFCKL